MKLIIRILLGIGAGVVIGLVANEWVARLMVTISDLIGSFIFFYGATDHSFLYYGWNCRSWKRRRKAARLHGGNFLSIDDSCRPSCCYRCNVFYSDAWHWRRRSC